jgi:Protein of unknown function (DUF3800)
MRVIRSVTVRILLVMASDFNHNLRVYLREIVRAVHPQSCELKLLGMFRAYFDESGIHGESKILVMACYLAPAKEWDRFIPKWQAVLNKYGVNIFHATHCNGYKGEFRKFKTNPDERNEFVSDLLILLSSRPRIVPFSVGVVFKDYDELLRPSMEPDPEHPYHIAMKSLLSMIGVYSQEIGRFPAAEKIACFFERQTEFSSKALYLFNRGVIDKQWKSAQRLGSITYGSASDYIPLQAADALAYDTYRELSRQRDHPTRDVRPSYDLLMKNAYFRAFVWDNAFMKEFKKRPDAFTVM